VSDWVKEAAAKIRQEKERQEVTKEYQAKLRDTLVANTPVTFDALLLQVERDVQAFNKEFPGTDQRLEFEKIGNTSFQVKRSRGWAFILTVVLNQSNAAIYCETKKPNMTDGQLYSTSETFKVRMKTETTPVLSDGSKDLAYEEISKKLLMPALEYFA